MKKPLSALTSQDVVEITAALGLNYKQLASALGKHQATISGYISGNPVPQDVADKLQAMLVARRKQIEQSEGIILASRGSMIVYQNEHKSRDQPHRTEARFMRRQAEPDTRTFPVYRMSRERFRVYAEALSKWAAHVRELARTYTDEKRQRDYQLELADLKAMAETAPRAAPYDVCITRTEWDVVSRALRHLATKDSDSLRCHWLRYRGSGYPKHRPTASQQEGQTS